MGQLTAMRTLALSLLRRAGGDTHDAPERTLGLTGPQIARLKSDGVVARAGPTGPPRGYRFGRPARIGRREGYIRFFRRLASRNPRIELGAYHSY